MSGIQTPATRLPDPRIVADCVHCGFCLDSCPTYALWADEADSPRGRIVLIAEALADGGELSERFVEHFDSCLGCLGCVTACPSGVRYDRLLERVRPLIEQRVQRPAAQRALRLLLFETLPYPQRMRRLAPLLAAARRLGAERLPERLAVLAKVAPRTPAAQIRAPDPAQHTLPPAGRVRGRVGLLLGCVARVFFGDVHRATISVLAAEGFEVLAPSLPDCCGALELHAGEEEQGLARAQATIDAFGALGKLDHVVVNAAGCGAAMKSYGELLGSDQAHEFSSRVRDVCELLAEIEPRASRGPLARRVVYHDACHLAHAQGVRSQPRALLRAIPGLELVEVPSEPHLCCGSAGVYNILCPEPAAQLGQRKARSIITAGAEELATANPGCAAQLDRHLRELGHPMPISHPVQILWRSLRSV